MSDKFIDNVTPICADWLNTVDQLIYEVFDEATTDQEARDAISVPEDAPQDGYGYSRRDKAWVKTADLPELTWEVLYLGAFESPPLETPTGQPLIPGMICFDQTEEVAKVWTGLYWQPLSTARWQSAQDQYVKQVVAASTITTTTPDDRGSGFSLETGASFAVVLNGSRLVPYSDVDSFGDYTVDTATDTITFLVPATGTVQIDQWRGTNPAGAAIVVATLANRWEIAFVESPDGSRTTFTMQDTAGNDLNIAAPAHVEIFVDGIRQRPSIDYSVSGSSLFLTTAPLATSVLWGTWIDDDGSAIA